MALKATLQSVTNFISASSKSEVISFCYFMLTYTLIWYVLVLHRNCPGKLGTLLLFEVCLSDD